jgi:hypothetical protein
MAAMAVSGLAFSGLAAAATPSVAAAGNGVCESGEFCLWYNPNYANGIWDMYASDSNLHDNRFIGNSSQVVGNNSASAKNRDSYRWYVCDGTGYTTCTGWYDPGDVNPQMSSWRNKISSAYWSS